MAKMHFLIILLVVTYFIGGIVSVTDKEFERRMDHLTKMFENQVLINQHQEREIIALKEQVRHLESNVCCGRTPTLPGSGLSLEDESIQNTTIEERVTILEIQVDQIQDDVTDLGTGLTEVDDNVDFLFDEQVIQDERLLGLENRMLDIENKVEVLQVSTISLDFRVEALEDSVGNNSVVELEGRVETLEETAGDHGTRISVTEVDISDLEVVTADQETRLTVAEENIQELQMTDVELETKILALEENQNETIAFYTVLTSYTEILYERPVLFNEILINEGNGYDSSTGTFTVPPGGDGFYYFFVYLVVIDGEMGHFDMQVNGETVCRAFAQQTNTPNNDGPTSCAAVSYVTEGDVVQVVYIEGTDTTPLWETANYANGFTGFRI